MPASPQVRFLPANCGRVADLSPRAMTQSSCRCAGVIGWEMRSGCPYCCLSASYSAWHALRLPDGTTSSHAQGGCQQITYSWILVGVLNSATCSRSCSSTLSQKLSSASLLLWRVSGHSCATHCCSDISSDARPEWKWRDI